MRILQVIPGFSPFFGGPVSVVRSISKELARRHDITVYTTCALDRNHDFERLIVEKEEEGFRIVFFPRVMRFSGFSISPAMARVLRETINHFDVIHLHSLRQFQDLIVLHYARKHRVPYILQTHGSIPLIKTKLKLKRIYDIFVGKKLLENASKIIALSQVEAQQLTSLGIPPHKVAIIPNGIDLTDYQELPSQSEFRAKFRIPAGMKIILYLGRIHATKGIDLLIKAFSLISEASSCASTLLVIAGPDDGDLERFKSLANSLGVSNSIVFTGFLSEEEKLQALVAADVFVTPSFYGFPVTFLEACATGTPIITSRLGDTLEWIDGNAGIVTSTAPSDLAGALCKILSDSKLRRRLSTNCRLAVESSFSITSVVSKLERLYREVTLE